MSKIKIYCFFLSFVLVMPLFVATVNFVLENTDDLDAQSKCFNLQEEEEDSEEDTDDSNEDAKHFTPYQTSNPNPELAIAKLLYGNLVLEKSSYQPGVLIPPPELS